jgi:hypothetical protein
MWKTSLLLCAVLIGCHSSMDDDMNSMRSHIDDTRRETIGHLDVTRTATTMEHMRAEMDRHRNQMAPTMADMDSTMESMTTHCDGLGLGKMRAMHGELESEVTQHFSAIEANAELAAVKAEVERHGEAMLAMMDGMDGAMGNMHCQ